MRILVISPDNSMTPKTAASLAREGFLVDKTRRVQKGIWMTRTNPYDMVILSIVSFEKLMDTVMKLTEEPSSIFFMALLTNPTLEKRIILLEHGTDEVLACPYSFRELTVKIHNLLRREKAINREPACLKIDDLVINANNFSVTRGRKEISLRRKEFDLLHYLYCNQGKVINKMNILEGVWDPNADIFTNTLEVHILSLRRKIDLDYPEEHKLIHTVYGRGYLFGLKPALSEVIPARASFLSS